MNMVFFDLLDTCVVIYLDGLLIFSKKIGKYQKALDFIFAYMAKY